MKLRDPALVDLKRLRRGITPKIRDWVFAGCDHGWCHYCGFAAHEIDHVVPVSRGGGVDLENLVPVCDECNHEKLDLTVDEWVSVRRAAGKPWPIPSFNERIIFLCLVWGIRPKLESAQPRWVIRDYDQFRRLLIDARDYDLAELLPRGVSLNLVTGVSATDTPVTYQSALAASRQQEGSSDSKT
jgi:hypothetical protein